MSLLAGHLPHLPPVPKAAPEGEVGEGYRNPPARDREAVRLGKDWTGWVNPAGTMVALRRGRSHGEGRGHDGREGRLWVFRCLLCGSEVERLPRRLKRGDVQSCGCGPMGPHAPRLREERMARTQERGHGR